MPEIKELVFFYLLKYGYIVLFFSFLLELMALPLPGELIMGYVGYLSFQGKMNWFGSIMSVTLGLCSGITLAYYVGRKFGHPFFIKYGHYIRIGPKQMDSMGEWFEKYGNKVLIAGFFIPGIRHFTGYFAGIIEIPLRVFMTYAYLGAFLFASTFISLGRLMGPDWDKHHGLVEKYISIIAIIAVFIFLIVYLLRTYNLHFQEIIAKLLGNMVERYHCSLLRAKIMASIVLVAFSALVVVMIGLIQDYLAKDFGQFDMTLTFLINIFIKENSLLLTYASYLTSIKLLSIGILFGVTWIIFKSKERWLDMASLIIAFIGGQALQGFLRLTFHRFGPIGSSVAKTFPSEQAFLVLVILGYTLFLFLRYSTDIAIWIRTIFTLIICFALTLVGFNHIILGIEAPSDVLAGYVFGAVWLSFILILLEIVRLHTPTNDSSASSRNSD